jgi:hypothetical protein
VNPDDVKEPFSEEWGLDEYPSYSQHAVDRSKWNKWIVRTVEGEAESEKIFYNSTDANSHCMQQLREGKCAYIVEALQNDSDIPF